MIFGHLPVREETKKHQMGLHHNQRNHKMQCDASDRVQQPVERKVNNYAVSFME